MTIFRTGPNGKNFSDDNLHLAKMIKLVLDMVENLVGKSKTCCLTYYQTTKF